VTRVAIRRLAKILNGGTPTPDEANWNGDVPWATPVDLAKVNGRNIERTERTLTDAGLVSGSTLAPRQSVLVSCRAPIGYTAVARVPIAFNQGCKAVVPVDGQDARFLRYCLVALTETMKASGSGSTFLELSSEALASVEIPDATPGEQRRIADFLDDRVARIDQIITARSQQISALAQLRLSSMDDIVRGAGPPARLGRHVALGAVGVVVNPSSYFRDEGVPFVHGNNVRDGFFDLTDLKRMSTEDSNSLSRSALREHDVLVVRAGYPGRAAVVTAELAGGNCASVLLLRPAPDLDPRWLSAFFNSPVGKSQVAMTQYGAAQGVINLSDVVAFEIPLPTLDEQQTRVERLADLEAAWKSGSKHLAKQMSVLNEYKQSLITAAVTGELDVTTAGSGIPNPH
jgi:type I restriction enzyme S subunit